MGPPPPPSPVWVQRSTYSLLSPVLHRVTGRGIYYSFSTFYNLPRVQENLRYLHSYFYTSIYILYCTIILCPALVQDPFIYLSLYSDIMWLNHYDLCFVLVFLLLLCFDEHSLRFSTFSVRAVIPSVCLFSLAVVLLRTLTLAPDFIFVLTQFLTLLFSLLVAKGFCCSGGGGLWVG